jgi:hypothetical protein
MSDRYKIECDCGGVKASLHGVPKVRGFCHCEDCRELLKIPYHSVTAWEKEQVNIDEGADQLIAFQHPTKRMKRFYCSNCGETLFNSNAADWRVVSQLLIRKCYGGELPEPLHSKMHFFYARRIVDVADDLPKRD